LAEPLLNLVHAATAADIDALAALDARCFSPPWGTEHFRDELAREASLLLMAREGATLLGFLDAWVVYDELQIMRVVSAPEARRRGVGRALMHHAETAGRRRGLAAITLEVRANNQPAAALYEALGMRSVGRRPRYYKDGEAALLYRLELGG
jgi:ribosomal-protein-alanine acetyltransferase